MAIDHQIRPGTEAFPYARKNTYVLSLATFISTVGFGVSFPFLPLMVLELDPTADANSWVGYITGSFFLIGFLTTPLWGSVADHFGRKAMVLRTSLGMGLLHMLIPFSPSLSWIMVIFLLLGTTNGFVPAAQALVATTNPSHQMGRALSLLHTGTWLGTSLGPVAGAFLAGLLTQYRSMYWVTGGLVLSAGLLGLFFTHEEKRARLQPFRLTVRRDLRITLALPQVKVLFPIAYLFAIVYLGNVPVMSLYTIEILEKAGITGKSVRDMWVGVVAVGLPLASAISAPLWGRFLDRTGPERTLGISLVTGTLATIPLVLVTTPITLALSRLGVGVFSVGIGLSVMTAVKARAPKGMEARVLAFLTAVSMLGFGSGPFLAGQIAPWWGLRGYLALNSLSLAAMTVIWFGLVLGGRITPYQETP